MHAITSRAFSHDEFIEKIKDLSLEELNKMLDKAEADLEEYTSEYDSNRRMIERFYDDPGMEHLLNMSIRESAKPIDILIAECKVKLLQQEITNRSESTKEEVSM